MTGFIISRDQATACYNGHDLVFEKKSTGVSLRGSCARCAFRCAKIAAIRSIDVGRTFPCIPSARYDRSFGCWRPAEGYAGMFTS